MSPNQKVVEQVEVKQVSEQCNMHSIEAHMFNSEEFSLDPHSDLLYTIFGPIILHAHLAHRLETGNQNGDKMVAKKREETGKRGKQSKGHGILESSRITCSLRILSHCIASLQIKIFLLKYYKFSPCSLFQKYNSKSQIGQSK